MVPRMSALSMELAVPLFLLAAAGIGLGGVALAGEADRLADRSGLGEAVMGALFLGGVTSLSGIVTSVTAAAEGHAGLSIGNAVGGIAAQTAFLGIADIAYRKANLEHAAASPANLTQGALLITLLSIPLFAMAAPPVTVLGVNPASVIIVAGYAAGLRLISKAHKTPMWLPRRTRETWRDRPEPPREGEPRLRILWLRFTALAAVVATLGYVVTQTGVVIAAESGLSETFVGAMFTAVATSLPELVTAVAAVRRGALTLAVADILGGNSFDVMLVAFADVAYREGSIFHALDNQHLLIVSLSMLMTGILLLGLLRRERFGFGNIGFESALVLSLYAGGSAVLYFSAP